jgi:phage host-nuclease inhibitor protein Gam
MAIEKLEQPIVERLKSLNTKIGELSLEAGRLHLKKIEIEDTLKEIEKEYIQVSTELNVEIIELDKKYPNGEIDLIEGTVTF